MNIVIGGDHAGYELKAKLIGLLQAANQLSDIGPFSAESCDYPDFAHPLAEAVATGKSELGILICGSGNGVCMTANKHQGVRAALCWNVEVASLARQHNNANVLCIPARFVDEATAVAMVNTFLFTAFEGSRHLNRTAKIDLP
ncbi:MAG: RpiB/LacA/LacB family sugar-phosphate isomerase [Flavobacteriaceae bacterium]|nr:RpiB/LacA/LacB family sugar-phosphate isomerase [Flavobacteriaceae bacterium]